VQRAARVPKDGEDADRGYDHRPPLSSCPTPVVAAKGSEIVKGTADGSCSVV